MSVVLNVSWSILAGRTGFGGDVFLSRGSVCVGDDRCGEECVTPFDPVVNGICGPSR